MVYQVGGGVWRINVAAVGGTPAYTIYVWSRNSMQDETYASTQASPLPIKGSCTIDPVPSAPSIGSRAAFLTWVCQQVGGNPTLNVVDQSSTYVDSTSTCG